MRGTYAYSLDRESFTGVFNSRAEAFEAGCAAADRMNASVTEIYVGQRVAGDPQANLHAWEIVKSLGLRTRGVTVVACPTCGRLDVDNFVEIVTEIERRLAHVEEPLHLSIMGCAVNGPGEAHDSQLGITFGRGVGMIFKDGVPMRKVAGEDIVEAFVKETEKLLAEGAAAKPSLEAVNLEPALLSIK